MEYLKVIFFIVIGVRILMALRAGLAKQKANAPGKAGKPIAQPVSNGPRPSKKRESRFPSKEARSLEQLGGKAISLEKQAAFRDIEAEALQQLQDNPYSRRVPVDNQPTPETPKTVPVITDWRQAVIASVILERKEY